MKEKTLECDPDLKKQNIETNQKARKNEQRKRENTEAEFGNNRKSFGRGANSVLLTPQRSGTHSSCVGNDAH